MLDIDFLSYRRDSTLERDELAQKRPANGRLTSQLGRDGGIRTRDLLLPKQTR